MPETSITPETAQALNGLGNDDGLIKLKHIAIDIDVSYKTLWHWSTRGVRGVVLWTLSVGHQVYTRRSAIAAFLSEVNAKRSAKNYR